MERRPLNVTVISAKDLKDVNMFTTMDVYAVVSIKGDPNRKQKLKTPVHKDSGPNPRWSYALTFTLDEDALQHNRLTLKLKLKSERSLGDRPIGVVRVPIKELFDTRDEDQKEVSYPVRMPSGKSKGTLFFSFKFRDNFTPPAPEKAKEVDDHVAAYPAPGYPGAAAGTSGMPYPAPGAYPAAAPPPPYNYAYPQQGGYPPPPQQAYAGYPPAPGYGYGYQGYPPQPGYGGYPTVQQPQKPKKGGGNMALGIGAGLLGGLVVGEMISDVGDAAAYDAGYDAGFDDGFDF